MQRPYISRAEVIRLSAIDDPDVDESHIFQGDIFHSIEFRVPHKVDGVQCNGMVISHDCEYTKTKKRPTHPLLVAPLRELSSFRKDEADLVRNNRYRHAVFLPNRKPLDDEYLVDLRLIQPISIRDLQEYQYMTSISPAMKKLLRAKVVEFITRELTLE